MITPPNSSASPKRAKKQFSDTAIIGQENLLREQAGYTTRELSTASIVLKIMKSTLKVHNPRVIILLICIHVHDVQGKEPSF